MAVIDLDAFVRTAEERQLFPRKRNRVLVACSGGPDSFCLLYLLWACREPLRLDLSVLTCDHGLRPENETEATEVRQRAWALGLPCAFRRLHVEEQREAGESVEMAARRLRRLAYAEVARSLETESVALGHHQDDQAETVLLRLTRGTGPRGAGGMSCISPLVDGVSLIRPLLGVRRRDVEETLLRWGVPVFRDPSNESREHTRNRMRLDVLPELENINPGVVQHLADFAEDQQRLEQWASLEASRVGAGCRKGNLLLLEPWRFLPAVLRERVLLGWFRDVGGSVDQVGRRAWNQILPELMEPATHSRKWEMGAIALIAERDVMRAGGPEGPEKEIPFDEKTASLLCPSLHRTLHVDVVKKVDRKAASLQELEGELTGYVKRPTGGFRLRTPRSGDRYRPQGMKGRVRVSDLLANAKVPASVRPLWPVITSGEEIVWVPGFRVADSWQVTGSPCIRFTLEAGDPHTFCG